VMRLGGERFSWGSTNLQDDGAVRQRYIAALRTATESPASVPVGTYGKSHLSNFLQSADDHDIGPLLTFARS
jgi:hypothetical protein